MRTQPGPDPLRISSGPEISPRASEVCFASSLPPKCLDRKQANLYLIPKVIEIQGYFCLLVSKYWDYFCFCLVTILSRPVEAEWPEVLRSIDSSPQGMARNLLILHMPLLADLNLSRFAGMKAAAEPGGEMPARDLREWSGRADLKCRTARLLTPRTKNLPVGPLSWRWLGSRLPPLAVFTRRAYASLRRSELGCFAGRQHEGFRQDKMGCQAEVKWSGRADLNCRPLAPQASALPG